MTTAERRFIASSPGQPAASTTYSSRAGRPIEVAISRLITWLNDSGWSSTASETAPALPDFSAGERLGEPALGVELLGLGEGDHLRAAPRRLRARGGGPADQHQPGARATTRRGARRRGASAARRGRRRRSASRCRSRPTGRSGRRRGPRPSTLPPAAPRASASKAKLVVSPVPSCLRTSSSPRMGGRRESAIPSRAASSAGAGTLAAAAGAARRAAATSSSGRRRAHGGIRLTEPPCGSSRSSG